NALLALARSRTAVVLAVLLPIAGCATMAPKPEPPRLSVVSIGMVSADIFSQQFRVRLVDLIDNVLALKVQQGLERRLQTIVYRQGLARSPKQARQLITHGHIAISGKRVSIPGYRVARNEEGSISYYGRSPLAGTDHAERARITRTGR
ncbi:MAG: 30S ribosomal protein S4, partial [Methanoregulaceae archaeon]|nr:30S ribosomal protein S4 [Methanoregulaceae archaeon]